MVNMHSVIYSHSVFLYDILPLVTESNVISSKHKMQNGRKEFLHWTVVHLYTRRTNKLKLQNMIVWNVKRSWCWSKYLQNSSYMILLNRVIALFYFCNKKYLFNQKYRIHRLFKTYFLYTYWILYGLFIQFWNIFLIDRNLMGRN